MEDVHRCTAVYATTAGVGLVACPPIVGFTSCRLRRAKQAFYVRGLINTCMARDKMP